jgi:hypothetical protein
VDGSSRLRLGLRLLRLVPDARRLQSPEGVRPARLPAALKGNHSSRGRLEVARRSEL